MRGARARQASIFLGFTRTKSIFISDLNALIVFLFVCVCRCESTFFSATLVYRTRRTRHQRPFSAGPVHAQISANSSRAAFAVSRREFVETGAASCDFTSYHMFFNFSKHRNGDFSLLENSILPTEPNVFVCPHYHFGPCP